MRRMMQTRCLPIPPRAQRNSSKTNYVTNCHVSPIILILDCTPTCSVTTLILAKSCCCCSHINSHKQVRGHRTGSSHSGAEEYPGKEHKQTKGGTRIYHSRRSSCSRQIKIEREIGSQPKMCEVHTGTCIITLFALGKTKYWHRVQQAVI